MSEKQSEATSYAEAGVNIDLGNELVGRIKTVAGRTRRPEVQAGIGGFAALFELPMDRYQKPVLVSATDGVGTKLKVALELGNYAGLGVDLVAMSANDLIVCGAEPLFFLDYYATGKLDVDIAEEVIKGIGDGCIQAGMSLIGGETAEMPGLYQAKDFDIAGFCVGVVEKDRIIDGSNVKTGDALIGIASSGPHANGFSLIRHILTNHGIEFQQPFEKSTVGEALLTPTKIYVNTILELNKKISVHALSHITGGGLLENIPRVMPNFTKAVIDSTSWQQPALFSWLKDLGKLSNNEYYRTFNAGIGMVVCIPQDQVSDCLKTLNDLGETAWHIGSIETSTDKQPNVELINL